jgi:hypothetical protein
MQATPNASLANVRYRADLRSVWSDVVAQRLARASKPSLIRPAKRKRLRAAPFLRAFCFFYIIRTPRPGGSLMTAFNAVRFRLKPGRDQEFLDAHKKIATDWPGLRRVNIIKAADRSYCIIAEWIDMDALAKARPNMIATLDSFRDTLEDLGGGLGVTDPISGPVVLELK